MSDTPETENTPAVVTPTIVKENWLYVGRRVGNDGKVSHVVARGCDEPGFDPLDSKHRLWYASPVLGKHAAPGHVYTVEFERKEEGGKANIYIFTKGERAPRYARRWTDRAVLLRLVAEDEAAEARIARAKREKDSRESTRMRELLRPVRDAYFSTNKAGQKAILAAVIAAVTDPFQMEG